MTYDDKEFRDKLILLKKDFENFQGQFNISNDGKEFYVEFERNYHKLEEILNVIYNRLNYIDISIDLIYYDTLIIKKYDR